MKIWVDDIRTPPDPHWCWAKTSNEAIGLLDYAFHTGEKVRLMSLDHDLGGTDTTRPVVLHLCNEGAPWPVEVKVHSANPVGVEWLEGMIERYKA